MSAVLGRLLSVLLVVSASAVLTASSSVARSCDEMTGLVMTSDPQANALVVLPRALVGAAIPPEAVAVSQSGSPVAVLSWRRSDPAFTDVMVVVDTSAAAAPSLEMTRRTVAALIGGLPSAVSVGVLSAGGAPEVVRERAPGPVDTAALGAELLPRGDAVLRDAALAAVRALPASSSSAIRERHVVVVGAGTDVSSTTSGAELQAALEHRGIALDVIDVTSTPSLPEALPTCPAGPAAAAPEEFGRSVAAAIADSRRLTLPPIGDAPVTVTLSTAGVTAQAVLQRRGSPAPSSAGAPESRVQPTTDGGTLLQSLLLGLAGVLLLVIVLNLLTGRGAAFRRVARELAWTVRAQIAERGVADDLRRAPRAELVRIRADAWQDLMAAWGDAPAAREIAELAAREEDRARAAASEHADAEAERLAGRERAADRRDRAHRRALELMALERADRERRRLATGADHVAPAEPEHWAEDAVLAAPDIVIPAYRARLVAENRKADAARAAAAALVQAQEAEEAAARARDARQEAEDAAQAARSAAAADRRAAAEAEERRALAEAEVAAAADDAAAAQALADEAHRARIAAQKAGGNGHAPRGGSGKRPAGTGTPARRPPRKRVPAPSPTGQPPGTVPSPGGAGDDAVIDLRPPDPAGATRPPDRTEAALALRVPKSVMTVSAGTTTPAVRDRAAAPAGAPPAALPAAPAPSLPEVLAAPAPAPSAPAPGRAPAGTPALPGAERPAAALVRGAPLLVLLGLVGRPLVHREVWLGTGSPSRLVGLLLGLIVATAGVRLLRAASRSAAEPPPPDGDREGPTGLVAAAEALVLRLHATDEDPSAAWADFELVTGLAVPADLRVLVGFRPDVEALLRHLAVDQVPVTAPAQVRGDLRAGLALVLLGTCAALLA